MKKVGGSSIKMVHGPLMNGYTFPGEMATTGTSLIPMVICPLDGYYGMVTITI